MPMDKLMELRPTHVFFTPCPARGRIEAVNVLPDSRWTVDLESGRIVKDGRLSRYAVELVLWPAPEGPLLCGNGGFESRNFDDALGRTNSLVDRP